MANKSQSYNKYFSNAKSELRKDAIRGGGITILSHAMNQCIQMVATMFLARILTPDDYGYVIMVASITGFFLVFKDVGLSDAIIQEANINHRIISTLFWINLAVSIVMTMLIIAISPLIAWFYDEPKLMLIAIISSTSFILAGLSIQHIALLKRNMLFSKIAINEIVAVLLSFIIAIVLSLYGWGYWSLVVRPLVYALSVTLGAWSICKWRPGLPSYRSEDRSMLIFGMNSTGYYLVNYFARNLDNTLIGWQYGAKELGYYQKAFFLFLAPVSQLTISLQSVAVATLSKLRTEPEKYRNYYIKAISNISFIGIPMSAFMVVESSDIIHLLLGPQWEKTAEIFAILGIGTGIRIVSTTQGWLYVSLGRADRWLYWGIISSLSIVFAILIGLPFGSFGVAIAYTLITYILAIPGFVYAGKPIDLKLRAIVSAIWRYFIGAAIAGFICWNILHYIGFVFNSLTRIIISLVFFVCLYLILIVILYGGPKPITQFITLIGEIYPNGLFKRIIVKKNIQ